MNYCKPCGQSPDVTVVGPTATAENLKEFVGFDLEAKAAHTKKGKGLESPSPPLV